MSHATGNQEQRGGQSAPERSQMAKGSRTILTEEQEKEICSLWQNGTTKTKLARLYHVAVERIDMILEDRAIESSNEKNVMDWEERKKEEWDVITAALRGDIPAGRMVLFFRGKLGFKEAMKG